MSATSPSTPPVKRSTLLRFGMRTVFVLIGLAAIAVWWARGEMLKEQRREELIATFKIPMNSLHHKDEAASWRKRLGAWLRGKRPTPAVSGGILQSIPNAQSLDALATEFPLAEFQVQLFGPASPEVLAAFAKFKKLDWVRIPFNREPDDETVKRLAAIHATQGISWNLERIDDAVIQKIADAGIEVVYLEQDYQVDSDDYQAWGNVTDEGLRNAAKLPKLVVLNGSRKASDSGVAPFRSHPAVTHVQLVGSGYTDASANVMETLSRLNSLVLCDTRLSDAGIARAISDRKIERLQFDGAPIGEATAAEIAKLSKLESFTIRNVPLPPSVIAALLKLPIKRLAIEGDYDDATVASLAPLAPQLTYLTVAAPRVTDAGLTWLKEAKKLHKLHLRDTQITSATIRLIPAPRSIEELSLGGPNINASVLEAAGLVTSLRTIRLCGDSIDDEAIAALPYMIDDVTLTGTRVSPAGLKSLRIGGPRWITINFAGTEPPFSDDQIKEVAAATNNRVNVGCNGLTPVRYQQLLPKSTTATQRGSP